MRNFIIKRDKHEYYYIQYGIFPKSENSLYGKWNYNLPVLKNHFKTLLAEKLPIFQGRVFVIEAKDSLFISLEMFLPVFPNLIQEDIVFVPKAKHFLNIDNEDGTVEAIIDLLDRIDNESKELE